MYNLNEDNFFETLEAQPATALVQPVSPNNSEWLMHAWNFGGGPQMSNPPDYDTMDLMPVELPSPAPAYDHSPVRPRLNTFNLIHTSAADMPLDYTRLQSLTKAEKQVQKQGQKFK